MQFIFTLVVEYFSLHFIWLWLGCLVSFVGAKVLVRDSKLSIKEVIYIIFAAFLCSSAVAIPQFLSHHGVSLNQTFAHILTHGKGIVPAILLFIYFYKLKSFSTEKAIILAMFSYLINFAAHFLARFIFFTLFGSPYFFNIHQPVLSILTALFASILAALFALVVVKVTTITKLHQKINENPNMQTVLMIGSLIGWITYEVISSMIFFTEGPISSWMSAILLGYVLTTILSFSFYTRSLNAKLVLQQKESEQRNLLFYTNEIEQQQIAIRKFRHDQQNLFTALDLLVQQEDWDGLAKYYPKVREAFNVITKSEFALDELNRIKVREVKNILLAKLVTAQNMGLNVSLEAKSDIDHISLDSVTLVRALGIILDNAIEELITLDDGMLSVACFKRDEAVTFIVRNTCREDIPPLRQLEQDGYSSKGSGRGLGLSNLAELVNSHPNIAMLTSVKNGNFTKELTIGEL